MILGHFVELDDSYAAILVDELMTFALVMVQKKEGITSSFLAD